MLIKHLQELWITRVISALPDVFWVTQRVFKIQQMQIHFKLVVLVHVRLQLSGLPGTGYKITITDEFTAAQLPSTWDNYLDTSQKVYTLIHWLHLLLCRLLDNLQPRLQEGWGSVTVKECRFAKYFTNFAWITRTVLLLYCKLSVKISSAASLQSVMFTVIFLWLRNIVMA